MAAIEPGERQQAVRLCRRPRRISKNQPFATPRRRADRRRPKSEIEMIGRECPGCTRWKTRSRAAGGGPRETHGAAPPANARQPSQPAGRPAFPAYPQKLSGFVRSRCPFVGTTKFFSQSGLRAFPKSPFATIRTTLFKLDWCQSHSRGARNLTGTRTDHGGSTHRPKQERGQLCPREFET